MSSKVNKEMDGLSSEVARSDNDRQMLRAEVKSTSLKSSNAAALENLRQNLAKRSLDAKFDLQGTDYKPIENIGIGAYGVVCSAIHAKSGDKVAIKKIPCVFEALSIAKRTYREIKILKHFKHDNIISIREILKPKQTVKDFKDIYVVFDLMESDLHRIIYSKQELTEEHIRYFLYQLLRGLKYIHSANVIHRDLKPSNVLVNEDCHLRIGDFGMARGVFYTPNEPSYYMTQYVATRWYRAPEILLSLLEYGAALDMWSVGCIFAEMIGRKHLFPGKDYISQVKLIVGVLGTPSEVVLKQCQHDILKKMIKGFGKKEPVSWEKLFPKASKKSLDLVSRMLVINPEERITVEQALAHRFLNNYHDPSDEPICVPTFNFDFEKEDMDKTCLRSAIMEEIMSFHQPKQPVFSFNAFLRPAPKTTETSEVRADAAAKDNSMSSGISVQKGLLDGELDKEGSKFPSGTESKPTNKISPVSVITGKFLLAPTADIEMLSAQSTGRAMETQPTDVEVVNDQTTVEELKVMSEDRKVVVDEKDSRLSSDKKGSNLISEDTKALVKQALMNATQRRQRAESVSEDSKESRPVTAAQRQREREEKRRRKQERALEKVKKAKEKKQPQRVILTNEDEELLRRWTVMQKPAQGDIVAHSPPHLAPSVSPPKTTGTVGNSLTTSHSSTPGAVNNSKKTQQRTTTPSHSYSAGSRQRQILVKTAPVSTVSLTPSMTIAAGQLASEGTLLFPSNQLISQANFIPVIAVPSVVNPGQLDIRRIFHHPTCVTAQVPLTTITSLDTLSNKFTMAEDVLRQPHNADASLHKLVERNSADMNKISSTSSHESSKHRHEQILPADMSSDQCPDSVGVAELYLSSAQGMCNKEDENFSFHSQSSDFLDFFNNLKDSPQKVSPPVEMHRTSANTAFLDHNQQLGSQSIPHTDQTIINQFASYNGQPHSLTPPPPYNSYSPEQLARSSSTPSLYRQNSTSPNPQGQDGDLRQRSSVPVAPMIDMKGKNCFTANNFIVNSQSTGNTLSDQFHDNSQSTRNNQTNNFTVNSQPTGNSQSDHFTVNSQPTGNGQSDHFAVSSQRAGTSQSNHFTVNCPPTETGQSDQFNINFQTSGRGQEDHFTAPSSHATFQSEFPNHLGYPIYSQTSGVINYDSNIPHPGLLFQNSSEYPLPVQQQDKQQQQICDNTEPYAVFQNFHNTSEPTPTLHYSQNFDDYPQLQPSNNLSGHQNLLSGNNFVGITDRDSQHTLRGISGRATSSSGSMTSSFPLNPAAKITLGPSALNSSQTGPRLSVCCSNLSQVVDSQNERIALLSKQFSKQHVMDPIPSLALTPRGTGAGYGVGMDLDAVLTDAQDHAGMRVEQSPLSSTLLADWLDISQNMSQADLEALAQELALQSPMHVSYDVNI